MHERERHELILRRVEDKPVATVAELVAATGASEATIRRDILALARKQRIRRVRGGAQSIHPAKTQGIAGRPFVLNMTVNIARKRAIARAAVDLCEDGDSIIINGGTTTFQMAEPLMSRKLDIMTNSFLIAEQLLRHSRNRITLPGGAIYREQNIILSPFENDVTRNFNAKRVFMGAQSVTRAGVTEADPLLIQAEQKLIGQGEELVLLVDSSKFRQRSSLILCPLSRVSLLITDSGLREDDREMIESAGVKLIVVQADEEDGALSA